MAYTLGNWYYFEAFGGNSGLFLNREGSGALQNHQNISIYKNTTGTADNPDHQFKLEAAYHNGVIEGCSIRSMLNEAYGLNIYGYGSDMTAEANCNLAIVGGTTSAASNYNDTLIDLLTVDGDQMLYRIKLIKHPGLFLTATSNRNNADVRWMKESGGSNQLWKLRTSETGGSSGGGSSSYGYPTDENYRTLSRGFTGANAHRGIDVVAPAGTPVYAFADGVVAWTQNFSGNIYPNGDENSMESMGNFIAINHFNPAPEIASGTYVQTVYMHLNGPALFNKGDPVSKGDHIGNVGNTGYSSGAHLHFNIGVGNLASMAPGYEGYTSMGSIGVVDPRRYLPDYRVR